MDETNLSDEEIELLADAEYEQFLQEQHAKVCFEEEVWEMVEREKNAPTFPKRKGGRPSQDRKCFVTVRFTEQEHEQLKQMCQETGLSTSDIIRHWANQIEIKGRVPAINLEALKELTAWGNNLNQLAYAVNSGSLRGQNSQQIRLALENIHAALLGVKEALK